jgi:hypothetical protein
VTKLSPQSFFSKAANPCFYTILALSYFFFILELLALKMNRAIASAGSGTVTA